MHTSVHTADIDIVTDIIDTAFHIDVFVVAD